MNKPGNTATQTITAIRTLDCQWTLFAQQVLPHSSYVVRVLAGNCQSRCIQNVRMCMLCLVCKGLLHADGRADDERLNCETLSNFHEYAYTNMCQTMTLTNKFAHSVWCFLVLLQTHDSAWVDCFIMMFANVKHRRLKFKFGQQQNIKLVSGYLRFLGLSKPRNLETRRKPWEMANR